MSPSQPISLKQKAALYGSVASSGGSIMLLITALSVLDQHGEELNFVRDDIKEVRTEIKQQSAGCLLRVANIETKLIKLESRLTEVERLMRDPRARPDSFTRSDWNRESAGLKHWADDRFKEKNE